LSSYLFSPLQSFLISTIQIKLFISSLFTSHLIFFFPFFNYIRFFYFHLLFLLAMKRNNRQKTRVGKGSTKGYIESQQGTRCCTKLQINFPRHGNDYATM
jgi:hypothetical protein